MKRVDDRIVYYVQKVAQKAAVHAAKKPPRAYTYRHKRLMAYKAEMHRRIEIAKQERLL